VVRAELAGLKPEDVKIEAVDSALILEASGSLSTTRRRAACTAATALRTFLSQHSASEGADLENIKAKFEHGVLEVTVPTPPQQSSRRHIQIETGSGRKKAAAHNRNSWMAS